MEEFQTLPVGVFVVKYSAVFKCVKCDDVRLPIEPFACQQGHFFCRPCISACQENKEPCPSGEHEITEATANISCHLLIGALKITCPVKSLLANVDNNHSIVAVSASDDHAGGGESEDTCEWSGSVASLQEHLQECTLYRSYQQTDIKHHQLRELWAENNTMKSTIAEMAAALENLTNQQHQMQQQQKSVTSAMQLANAHAHAPGIGGDEAKHDTDADAAVAAHRKEVTLGDCLKCHSALKYFEDELFNVQPIENRWQHIDCEYRPPQLDPHGGDLWSLRSKSPGIIIAPSMNVATLPAAGGQHQSVFGSSTVGVDSIGDGDGDGDHLLVCTWKIRVNKSANNNIHIGVVDVLKIHQSLSSDVLKHSIALHSSGKVNCFGEAGKSFQSGQRFTSGDVVCVVLDMAHNLIVFRINGSSQVVVPVQDLKIMLADTSWKVFVALCDAGDEVVLLGPNAGGGVENDVKLDKCPQCEAVISERDLQLNNLTLASGSKTEWQHVDCALSSYQLPELAVPPGNDIFNRLHAFQTGLQLSKQDHAFQQSQASRYQSVFGVRSVERGPQVWRVRLNQATSSVYIGIMDSKQVKARVEANTNAVPAAGAYYLAWNGQIAGGGLGAVHRPKLAFATGDTISVVVNNEQNTLAFAKNDSDYVLVRGAQLRRRAFHLFVTMYVVGDAVSICDDGDDDGDSKFDGAEAELRFGDCSACHKVISALDFDMRNVDWDAQNRCWRHINCSLKINVPTLCQTDADEWNPHPQLLPVGLIVYDKYFSMGAPDSGTLLSTRFGVISVVEGVKKWDVRVLGQASNISIGVIKTNSMRSSTTRLPSNVGYFLSTNGHISGSGLSIQRFPPLKVNDVVTVILDKVNNKLCFGVNNYFAYATGAVLRGSFNLFCTSNYQNTAFEIMHDGNHGDDAKSNEEPVGKCIRCSKALFECDMKGNMCWNDEGKSWCHIDCDAMQLVVPELDQADTDQWNRKTANSAVSVNEPYSFIGGDSSYVNTFGVITVREGVKVWDVKINCQPTHIYIGIITQSSMRSKPLGLPGNEGYYLAYNGYIQGTGVSIPMCSALKVNDRVKIILDMKKGVLIFGLNEKMFCQARGARIRNCAWNMFCSTYYANSSVSLLGADPGRNGNALVPTGKALYNCASCNKPVHEIDFEINNANFQGGGWRHIQCNFSIPKLSLTDRDMWHRMISNRNVTIDSYDATVDANVDNAHRNVFGIITVSKNVKQWNVLVANMPSIYHVYIGIIDSSNLVGRQLGIPTADGYYCTYNGYIQGSGLSINTGVTFKTGDLINVILDMNQGVLSFGKNNAEYVYAKGANIKGRSFNLFCTMHYANTKVTLQT